MLAGMKSTSEGRTARWFMFLALGGVLGQGAQQPAVITGRLEPDLVADGAITWNSILKEVSLEECGKLGIDAPKGARAFSGTIRMAGGQPALPVMLLEEQGPGARLWADTDRGGRFSGPEFHAFRPLTGKPRFSGELSLRVPLNKGPFQDFPLRVRLRKPEAVQGQTAGPEQRVVSYNFLALATGMVEVEGKPIRVWCGYNAQKGAADPANDSVGMDLDGDGELSPPPSLERVNPRGEDAIFRVGKSFVSLSGIDVEKRQVFVQLRTAGEYRVIELKAGTVVPDFGFTDFEGKPRRLSEFAGRFVLLDFWGSWCGPCIAEFPELKRAWAELRNRGLEIVGIDCNETVEEAKKAVAEHELGWTQATAESTRELVEQRLRIMAYPTKILLDGERRIISTGQDEARLSGGELLKTLGRVLPAPPR
jgi:thiol-disulfide isomerase/thioredoxin